MVVTLLAVVALVGGYAVLSVMHGGGQAAADADRTALSQVDAAQDTQAQVALQQVLGAARVLQAEAAQPPGFDRAGPGSLERYDPSLGVVPGASNGPATVSVAATAQGWGAAAMSASGTCFWIHQDAGSTVTYGSGSPCTGEAALAASGIAW